jgi:hypothetical protein
MHDESTHTLYAGMSAGMASCSELRVLLKLAPPVRKTSSLSVERPGCRELLQVFERCLPRIGASRVAT